MVVFKMRDSVPSVRHSPICNVLCLCRIWLIPTDRVYRIYDSYGKLPLSGFFLVYVLMSIDV